MNEKPEALAERLAAGRLAMVEQLTDEVDTLRRENERLKDDNERLRVVVDAIDAGDPSWKLMRVALRREPITVPRTVPLPRITCGFVDVRFDGDGWFCDKCGKRMSADFEASVRRGSGEKCYLELMQRKAEAVRTMSERNMK